MLKRCMPLVVVLFLASACGSTTPAASTPTSFTLPSIPSISEEPPPVSFEYSRSDVTPWPWTVNAMVVVCAREPGGATVAAAAGKRYVIVGAEVSSDAAGGFAKRSQIMIDPSNKNPSTQTFDARVARDCAL